MIITRRNRLIRRIAGVLAERAGREAECQHDADVAARFDGRHYELCCSHAYESAARDLYQHLTDRRHYRGRPGVGLPALQHMLGEASP